MYKHARALVGLAIAFAALVTFGARGSARFITPLPAFGPQGRNAIYGTVFGESRRPVADVYVELLDDVNTTLKQVKTDASGRFTFTGLVDG
ncbi:MAG TPA: carboxypeptidase-like regulatory domain-containing protein, partial [Blastocatellia bacterium]|nr:carboxypeptidase-like regulatory domain-containing protein [Blastocatellia bacterium]